MGAIFMQCCQANSKHTYVHICMYVFVMFVCVRAALDNKICNIHFDFIRHLQLAVAIGIGRVYFVLSTLAFHMCVCVCLCVCMCCMHATKVTALRSSTPNHTLNGCICLPLASMPTSALAKGAASSVTWFRCSKAVVP